MIAIRNISKTFHQTKEPFKALVGDISGCIERGIKT